MASATLWATTVHRRRWIATQTKRLALSTPARRTHAANTEGMLMSSSAAAQSATPPPNDGMLPPDPLPCLTPGGSLREQRRETRQRQSRCPFAESQRQQGGRDDQADPRPSSPSMPDAQEPAKRLECPPDRVRRRPPQRPWRRSESRCRAMFEVISNPDRTVDFHSATMQRGPRMNRAPGRAPRLGGPAFWPTAPVHYTGC